MSTNNKKPALGRGLSALLENAKTDITTRQSGDASPVVGSIALIKIKDLPQPLSSMSIEISQP